MTVWINRLRVESLVLFIGFGLGACDKTTAPVPATGAAVVPHDPAAGPNAQAPAPVVGEPVPSPGAADNALNPPGNPDPNQPPAGAEGPDSGGDPAGTKGRPAQSFTDCKNTETFADGHCYASQADACAALACSDQCVQTRSMPPQARCIGGAGNGPSKPEGRPAKSFSDCKKTETFADGYCYANQADACAALACSGECVQTRSLPPQARCLEGSGGTKPPEGRPVKRFTDCKKTENFAKGHCYPSYEDACAALKCSGKTQCVQMRSMPPQVTCRE